MCVCVLFFAANNTTRPIYSSPWSPSVRVCVCARNIKVGVLLRWCVIQAKRSKSSITSVRTVPRGVFPFSPRPVFSFHPFRSARNPTVRIMDSRRIVELLRSTIAQDPVERKAAEEQLTQVNMTQTAAVCVCVFRNVRRPVCRLYMALFKCVK